MKLWIRNQTRTEIMECNHLSVKETVFPNKKKSEWCVVANFGWVGTYESMERCIEIIDEIQELLFSDFTIIKNLNVCDDFQERLKKSKGIVYSVPNEKPTVEYHSLSAVVYEMPEK